MTQPQARIANLANHIHVLAHQAHLLFFTKSQLTQTVGHLRRRRQLLDAHRRTGFDLVQWTQVTLRTTGGCARRQEIVHSPNATLVETELQDGFQAPSVGRGGVRRTSRSVSNGFHAPGTTNAYSAQALMVSIRLQKHVEPDPHPAYRPPSPVRRVRALFHWKFMGPMLVHEMCT